MSNIQTGAERMPHDLSHLGFLAGQIGRLITISTTPVIAGDSFEMFFFQAEDGIRYLTVTGVKTCALPISWRLEPPAPEIQRRWLIASISLKRKSPVPGTRRLPPLT